jgi:hypothetical protein
VKLSPDQMARTTSENLVHKAKQVARKSARTAVVQARTQARTQVRGVRGDMRRRVIVYSGAVISFDASAPPSSLVAACSAAWPTYDTRRLVEAVPRLCIGVTRHAPLLPGWGGGWVGGESQERGPIGR